MHGWVFWRPLFFWRGAGPFVFLGTEEEARPVVRVVEQLELELVALDPPHRQRQLVLTLGGAARALVVPLGKLLALGGVLGLDALEPVERLEVGVLREQVGGGGLGFGSRNRVRVRVRVGVGSGLRSASSSSAQERSGGPRAHSAEGMWADGISGLGGSVGVRRACASRLRR